MSLLDLTLMKQFVDTSKTQTEFRPIETGAIDFIKMHSQFCPVLTMAIREHLSKVSVQVSSFPALDEMTPTTTTVESFDIPENFSVSREVIVTAISIFSGYRIFPSMFYDNDIARGEYESNKLNEVFQEMGNKKEAQILAHLNSVKNQATLAVTQVNNDTGVYAWNAGSKELEIDLAAQKNMLFGSLQTIFRINNRNKAVSMLVNTGGLNVALNTIEKLGQNNASNQQNTRNSLPPVFETLNLDPGSDQFAGYMAQLGAIGMVQNFPPDFRNNSKTADSEWDVTPFEVPHLKAQLNVFYNKEKDDPSAKGGSSANTRMSYYEEYGFLDRFFFLEVFNSDAANRVGDVVKLKGKAT